MISRVFRLTYFTMPGARLFSALISTGLMLAGCSNTALLLLHDDQPPAHPWAVVGLTLAGSAAGSDNRRDCIELAREQGVHVRRDAPSSVQATLSLTHYHGNLVSFADGRPERPIGQLAVKSACLFAIAAALRLEEKIQSSKADPPLRCELLGRVNGPAPTSWDFRKQSYELALAPMLLAAKRLGGNYIALDVLSPFGAHVPMIGRAFDCPPSAVAPASQPVGLTSPPAATMRETPAAP